jgi:nicotinamide-nucleotide amidase
MERTRAERLVADAVLKLRDRVGAYAYGEDDADLATVVLQECRAAGLKLAVAESCTGGLLGERVTSVPGSSDIFLGGVIAYHDDVKREILGVPAGDIERHGAVSEEVALQMAAGVKARLHADIGIAITGIAGPGGGTPEKPVGLVWIAVEVTEPKARRFQLIGDRAEIRQRAAQAALEMLRRALSKG